MSIVKFDPWTPKMDLDSFTIKPFHLLYKQFSIYFIYTRFHLNIT